MERSWPLVGRDAESHSIERLLRGDTRGLLFVGPAGFGKSRLVLEAVGRARTVRPPWTPIHMHGVVGRSGLALSVFGSLLDAETADAPTEVRAGAVAKALHDRGPRVLLAIDDLPQLDEASATLLLHELTSGTCALVASARDDEPLPGPLRTLWKDGLVVRIDIGPLDDGDIDTLTTFDLGGPVDDATRHALVTRCAGNPLYLRELLHGCVESGALAEVRGTWTLIDRVAPSRRLGELIEERIGTLSTEQRAVLDLVVLGTPCNLEWLRPDEHRDAINELERRQIIAIDGEQGVAVARAAHPLFGEVALASLTTLDRRRVAATLVERVEATTPVPPPLQTRVLLWRLDAGIDADPDALLEAARRARAADQIQLGLRFARAAYELHPSTTAALLLGEMLEINGNFGTAERVLAAATPDTEWERLRVGLARAAVLFRGLDRHDEAQDITDELRVSLTDPRLRAEATAARVSFHVYRGETTAALALARPLEAELDGRELLSIMGPLSTVLLRAGKYVEAAALSERATLLRAGLDEAHLAPQSVHFAVHLMSIAENGELQRAADAAQDAYEAAVDDARDESQRWLAGAAATINLTIGSIGAAERFARETASRFDAVNHPATLWGMAIWAVARAYAGDAQAAADIVSDCDARDFGATPFYTDMVVRARAWALAAQGELVRARGMLVDLARSLEASEEAGTEHVVLFDVARLGDPGTVRARMEKLAPSLDGDLASLRLTAVRALAARDADQIEQAAIGLEQLGATLYAAELANEAAVAFQADGEPRRATFARRRAEELAARCGAPATPALAHGTESARLTRREREIAGRAAMGLSSREIAVELGVSHRTIETHLQNAYDKLGVSSRTELTVALKS